MAVFDLFVLVALLKGAWLAETGGAAVTLL